MAYKCKIVRLSMYHFNGHYTHVCTVSKVLDMNTENKICLANKKYISVHANKE